MRLELVGFSGAEPVLRQSIDGAVEISQGSSGRRETRSADPSVLVAIIGGGALVLSTILGPVLKYSFERRLKKQEEEFRPPKPMMTAIEICSQERVVVKKVGHLVVSNQGQFLGELDEEFHQIDSRKEIVVRVEIID